MRFYTRQPHLLEKETLQRLRRGAVYAISDRLRAEYEAIVSAEIPPEFRKLMAKFNERQDTERAYTSVKGNLLLPNNGYRQP